MYHITLRGVALVLCFGQFCVEECARPAATPPPLRTIGAAGASRAACRFFHVEKILGSDFQIISHGSRAVSAAAVVHQVSHILGETSAHEIHCNKHSR